MLAVCLLLVLSCGDDADDTGTASPDLDGAHALHQAAASTAAAFDASGLNGWQSTFNDGQITVLVTRAE